MLSTPDGHLRVEGAGDVAHLAGRRVRVRGERDGDTLRDADVVSADAHAARAAIPAAVREPRRVAVLLIRRPGDQAREWAKSETATQMFAGDGSVDAWYRSLSDGKVSLTGDVPGWYAGGADEDPATCDFSAMGKDARAAATAAKVDLRTYDHLIYAFPREPACSWAGLGSMPGGHAWINGRPTGVRVLAHELGHNLGLHHASALQCVDAGAPATFSGACGADEYGDAWSVMGASRTLLFSSHHRAQLTADGGPLLAVRRLDVTRDGEVELATAAATEGTTLLRVPRAGGTEWLSLDLRTPFAPFDVFAGYEQGVVARLTSDLTKVAQSKVLDATPRTPGNHDGALRIGEPLLDPQSRSRITVLGIEGGVARVRVGFDPTPPGTPLAGTADGRVALTWPASEDDTGVAAYEVERDGQPAGEVTTTRYEEAAVPGRHVYRVTAVDAAGNRASSAPVEVDVPAPPAAEPATPEPDDGAARPEPPLQLPDPGIVGTGANTADRLAPRLRLVTPTGRRLAGRRVRLVAADAGGPVRITAGLDGRPLAERVATTWSLRLPRRALRGRHRVVLVATDPAGNATTLELTLRRGVLRRVS